MRSFWKEIGFFAGLMVIAFFAAVGNAWDIRYLPGACIGLAYAWGCLHG